MLHIYLCVAPTCKSYSSCPYESPPLRVSKKRTRFGTSGPVPQTQATGTVRQTNRNDLLPCYPYCRRCLDCSTLSIVGPAIIIVPVVLQSPTMVSCFGNLYLFRIIVRDAHWYLFTGLGSIFEILTLHWKQSKFLAWICTNSTPQRPET